MQRFAVIGEVESGLAGGCVNGDPVGRLQIRGDVLFGRLARLHQIAEINVNVVEKERRQNGRAPAMEPVFGSRLPRGASTSGARVIAFRRLSPPKLA